MSPSIEFDFSIFTYFHFPTFHAAMEEWITQRTYEIVFERDAFRPSLKDGMVWRPDVVKTSSSLTTFFTEKIESLSLCGLYHKAIILMWQKLPKIVTSCKTTSGICKNQTRIINALYYSQLENPFHWILRLFPKLHFFAINSKNLCFSKVCNLEVSYFLWDPPAAMEEERSNVSQEEHLWRQAKNDSRRKRWGRHLKIQGGDKVWKAILNLKLLHNWGNFYYCF